MASPTYYPQTLDGRADWWQNIIDNQVQLGNAGLSLDQVGAIVFDAAWGVYLYRTLRESYDDFFASMIAYANEILDGTNGAPLPTPLPPAGWPSAPSSGGSTVQLCGIEKRREDWVQLVKHLPGYSSVIGTALRLEASGTPFDPATYVCELFGLTSPGPRVVSGKFRKAGGKIDGINLSGRKVGTTAWVPLGRFNATPFTAQVPVVAPTGFEEWDFQARAVRRDVEIGVPSAIATVVVRA